MNYQADNYIKSKDNPLKSKQEFFLFLKHVFKSATSNTIRGLLTFLGIMICAVVFIISILRFEIQYGELQLEYSAYPQNTVWATGDIDVLDLYDFSEEFTDIGVIKLKSDYNGVIDGDNKITASIIGIQDDFSDSFIVDTSSRGGVYIPQLIAGRNFNANEITGLESATIINQTTAKLLFGDTNPLGKTIKVTYSELSQTKSYKVIGVLDDSYGMQVDYVNYMEKDLNYINIALYTPTTNLKKQSNNYNFAVFYSEKLSLDSIFESTKITNQEYGVFKNSSIQVYSYRDYEKQYNSTIQSFLTSYGTLVFLIIVFEALALAIYMIFSIKERIQEIGIRKAIGASNFIIVVQFMLEYLILGVLAVLMGIIFGNFINEMLMITATHIKYGYIFYAPSFMANIIVFLVSVFIITIMSFIPAIIARKTQITDALRFV